MHQSLIIQYLLNPTPWTDITQNVFKLINMLPGEFHAKQLKLNLVPNILNSTAPDYLNIALKLTRSKCNI